MNDERRDGDADAALPPEGRPGVALGAAIRRARSGRYTLAQLSARSGVSAGLLSLIERGRGNPSFNTLGAIADALDISLPDLVAEAIGESQNPNLVVELSDPTAPADASAPAEVSAPAGSAVAGSPVGQMPAQMIGTSIVLQRGQEARIAVLDGSLELTLRDRTQPADASRGRPLSVDLSLRSAAAPPQIPPPDDRRWRDLVRGEIPFEPTTLAGRMLFTHVLRCVRRDDSSPNMERWIRELRGFFIKYESVSAQELAQLFKPEYPE